MVTRKFKIKIEGKVFEAEVEEIGGGSSIGVAAQTNTVPAPSPPVAAPATAGTGKNIAAPMPGKVVSVRVSKGQHIKAGDTVIILEAMKMEQEIKATVDGTVNDIPVKEGETVTKNQPLVILG